MFKSIPKIWLFYIFFAVLGFVFSSISTYDYIAHLDRQVHAVTCSFIPGASASDISGNSGCHLSMMSPYSAIFKSVTWGGIPISILSFSVFAYMIWKVIDLFLRDELYNITDIFYQFIASLLPFITSLVFMFISFKYVHSWCKVCIGIYISSIGILVTSFIAFFTHEDRTAWLERAPKSIPWYNYQIYFLEGVAFVLIPLISYIIFKPSYPLTAMDCGSLISPSDSYQIFIPLKNTKEGVSSIEIIDPLCPACKALSERLKSSELDKKLNIEAVLFPLDSKCNWMVSSDVHPGACDVSEAILCSGNSAIDVLNWDFDNQEKIKESAIKDPKGVNNLLRQAFPKISSCIGSDSVKRKLNQSLRWAVKNAIPISTPQLYIQNKKVCDEDTDLGLEYVLNKKLSPYTNESSDKQTMEDKSKK